MPQLDLRKEWKPYMKASAKKPEIVDVPAASFLMVDGEGMPEGSKQFQEAIQALYGLAYTIKFSLKKAGIGPEYPIMPLEGLWWMKNDAPFDVKKKNDWRWTLMIMQPEHITKKYLEEAIKVVSKKKPNPMIQRVKLGKFKEGKGVQMMHIGPYAAEDITIKKMDTFAEDHEFELIGKHHEIYLGDPRKAAPEKLKTILRHPVRRRKG